MICSNFWKKSIFRIDDVINDVIGVGKFSKNIFCRVFTFSKHVWKFYENRSINKKVRGGGQNDPPPAMRSTTQMGGGSIWPPPYPCWQRSFCGKTAEPNYMRFFLKSREMNLVHWYFFVGPNYPPFSGFFEKTEGGVKLTPLPEEGLMDVRNSKHLCISFLLD